MKIRNCAGIIKPRFLLVHSELTVLTFHKPKLTWTSTLRIPSNYERTFGSVTRFRCSVADRTFASTSVSSSASKPNTVRLGRKQGDSSSLYTRPSSLDMKKERIANRAKVYEFMRGLGIIPDELDGLELPVTIEVMQ